MKRRAAAVVLAVVLAAALAGCSAGSSTSAPPPSAASVARQFGCTGIQPVDPPTLYAYDEVDATCGGKSADIATFRTDQLRDQWVKIASQFDASAIVSAIAYAAATVAEPDVATGTSPCPLSAERGPALHVGESRPGHPSVPGGPRDCPGKLYGGQRGLVHHDHDLLQPVPGISGVW